MMGKLQFLGTGGSLGIPMIGCPCAICHSDDPRNQRLRPSALLKLGHRKLLIDAGPDFRTQALRYGISHLDGLILTHAHHDHTAGLDDLRPLCFLRNSPLPVLLSAETSRDIQQRFFYLFQTHSTYESSRPRFDLQVLPHETGEVLFEGITFRYLSYIQAGMTVNGFRFRDTAYISDIRSFTPDIFEHLRGIKILIISALRYLPSPLHFSVDEAIDFAKKLDVEKVWLTHISHELEHTQGNAYLPANMHLAYDGLEIEVV